jgi:hypothetical protein
MSESSELSDEAIMTMFEEYKLSCPTVQLSSPITFEEFKQMMTVKAPVLSLEEIEQIREQDRLELQKVIDLQLAENARKVTEEIERQWAENKIKQTLEKNNKMLIASGKTQLNGSLCVEIDVPAITVHSHIMITNIENVVGTIILSEINKEKGFGISSTNSSDVGFVSWEVYS